jgi:hypothetical protein
MFPRENRISKYHCYNFSNTHLHINVDIVYYMTLIFLVSLIICTSFKIFLVLVQNVFVHYIFIIRYKSTQKKKKIIIINK